MGIICQITFFYPFVVTRKSSKMDSDSVKETNDTKSVAKGDNSNHLAILNGIIPKQYVELLGNIMERVYKFIGQNSNVLVIFFSGKGSVIMRLVINLSLSMYIINYYVIRLDFFTSRLMYSVTIYTMSQRILYSVILSFMAAYVFHVLIVAPYDKLRRSFRSKIKTK